MAGLLPAHLRREFPETELLNWVWKTLERLIQRLELFPETAKAYLEEYWPE